MLYKSILRPLLFQKHPESSHEMILRLLARLEFLSGALDKFYNVKDARLIVKVGPLTFANPVGLAAGFDKNALAPKTISSFGFGFMSCDWEKSSWAPVVCQSLNSCVTICLVR